MGKNGTSSVGKKKRKKKRPQKKHFQGKRIVINLKKKWRKNERAKKNIKAWDSLGEGAR